MKQTELTPATALQLADLAEAAISETRRQYLLGYVRARQQNKAEQVALEAVMEAAHFLEATSKAAWPPARTLAAAAEILTGIGQDLPGGPAR